MAESKNDRRQALELAISQIERQFGKGSVMRLGSGGPLEEIAVIPTGALSLDVALGIGGLPRGRVVEIYGRSRPARPRWLCTSSPRPRTWAASPPSSTPSTRSTPSMLWARNGV